MCSRCRFLSFFFFKQKTAYEMRISDLSSDVCSSDLAGGGRFIAKTGAEGVYTAASAELGIGIALKVLDGTARAAQTALGGLLERRGLLDEAGREAIRPLVEEPLTHWRGLSVGSRSAARRGGEGCLSTFRSRWVRST